ncbi:MAG TPA: hypothetical protein VKD70_15765 [Candidatus Acidoferrum sp.]|nr:hypothetical protein [Candidatus Acidoferrum sp.]
MKKLSVSLLACLALVFALPVRGQTGVNNSELSGSYAFTFNGVNSNGSIASVYDAVGRFTAGIEQRRRRRRGKSGAQATGIVEMGWKEILNQWTSG